MELIEVDKLRDDILNDSDYDNDTINHFLYLVDSQPTVDAEPVRRGKWIEVGSGFNYHFECSECGWKDGYPFNDRHKYCPNCKAKMTGGNENG